MATALDATDHRILDELQRGRPDVDAHPRRAAAHLPRERLRAGRAAADSGVIRGFRADIDPVASGLGTSAYVTLNVQQADWRQVREALRALPGIAHIGLVGGEFDVILLVRARDNADLRRLVLDEIQGMPGVVNTRTLLVFEEPEPLGRSIGEE